MLWSLVALPPALHHPSAQLILLNPPHQWAWFPRNILKICFCWTTLCSRKGVSLCGPYLHSFANSVRQYWTKCTSDRSRLFACEFANHLSITHDQVISVKMVISFTKIPLLSSRVSHSGNRNEDLPDILMHFIIAYHNILEIFSFRLLRI